MAVAVGFVKFGFPFPNLFVRRAFQLKTHFSMKRCTYSFNKLNIISSY